MENKLQTLTPADVVRAYKGKPGCACGCRGQYWTNEQSKTMVTKILRTLQANEELVKADCNWLEAQVNGKDYVVFLSAE